MARQSCSLKPRTWQRAAGIGAALVLALTAAGCLELIRRPDAADAPPTWVSAAADTTALPGSSGPAGPAATAVDLAAKRDPAPPRLTAAELASARLASGERAPGARERVRQVNEYVYWCLERTLWDEARIHLEQALAQDSLAASLHNNLGVVREQQGRPLEALAAYERAWQLQPKKTYDDNLRLLRKRLKEAERPDIPDSLRIEHQAGPAVAEDPNLGSNADSAATHQIQR